MTVKFGVPKSTATRLSSLSRDKFLKSQKNLCAPSPKLWPSDLQHQAVADVNREREPPFLIPSQAILDSLESCSSFMEFNQIQTQLIISGLFQQPHVSGRVIKKLCNSLNALSHAVFIFDSIDGPDAFMCNTILKGFLNLDDPFGASRFYHEKVVGRFVDHNHYTFPLLVKICSEIGSLREGEKVHARIVKLGFEYDLFIKNSLIHMYSLCGRIGDARQVFDGGFVLDLVSWNSIIDGYVKNGEVGMARELFDEMVERDILSWNSMIAGYVGIGDMKAARELFDKMPSRDIVSWNYMIDGYARIDNVSVCQEFFNQMPTRNVISWNVMLALFVRCKKYTECLKLFDRMLEGGEVRPNSASLVSVSTACAKLGRLDRGQWVHSYIKSNRIECDVLLSTALLTMYVKCRAMDLARDLFDKMPEKNVVSWNSIIMGYGMHGHAEKALQMFLDMEKNGPVPNDATFVCVLSACAREGKVLEGWWCFDHMCRVYKIEPNVEHCGCMFNLLRQVGMVEHSEDFTREAGHALWRALLSACRTLPNFKLGEAVAKQLMKLEPMDIGPYMLLSYIYAMEGRWNDVEDVRMMIKERLPRTAQSILVSGGESGSKFFMENTLQQRRIMVYSMMKKMGIKLKLSCTDYVGV